MDSFRRRFLQSLAGFCVTAPLAGLLNARAARAAGGKAPQSGVPQGQMLATLIDVDACDGCGDCVQACRTRHLADIPLPQKPLPDPYSTRNSDWSERRNVIDRLTPYNWLYIQSCSMQTESGPRSVFLPRRCMQCTNPPCANLCPTGAARQKANGAVHMDVNLCFGDGQCVRACPWSIPRRQSGVGSYLKFAPRYVGNGLMFKCDFCMDLLEQGQVPSCVAACPHQAQHIGPREEIVALAKSMAKARQGDIFGLNENGGTNTLYVSSQPFRDIEAALLRGEQVGGGRPSLRPAGASMDKENRLMSVVLLAPLAGAALGWLRVLRDRHKGRK